MPRKARIDAPGAFHHVIIRGIERKAIFKDDKDRDTFLSRLSLLLTETNTVCLAWSLMSNHVHLLLREPDGSDRAAHATTPGAVYKGMSKGRNPEYAGGGLIRSADGWREVREAYRQGTRLVSDERFLAAASLWKRS